MCVKATAVSVIVPVYNSQSTIQRCVESILNQTYGNFELLIIDDRSTDNTATLLHVYEQKDTRIKVIHQENAGVSSARNTGIKAAKGEWITFVDADDYLELDCLKQVILKENICNQDLIFWNYSEIGLKKTETRMAFNESRKELCREEMLPLVFYNDGKHGMATVYCKLFQRERLLSNHIFFKEEMEI